MIGTTRKTPKRPAKHRPKPSGQYSGRPSAMRRWRGSKNNMQGRMGAREKAALEKLAKLEASKASA